MRSNSESSASVLFVCLGNICRSPAAEGVMRGLVRQAGVEDEVVIDSAGTGRWHVGERADARMRQAAEARGVELTSRARQLMPDDLERFSLVVAMDSENRRDIERLRGPGSTAEVVLLSRFLDDGWPEDVPDPYYGGADGFDRVLDMLEAACPTMLEHLLRG